jgi:ferredoxin/flavodoxin
MIQIAYFTGTGGTARAAEAVEVAFAAHRTKTDLREIRRDNQTPDNSGDMLVLLFPVHAANAPKPVYEWLESLAPVQDVTAAVISVSGGGEVFPNLGCRAGSIRRLERKGYRVIYEQTIVMPSNFMEPTPEGYAAQLLRVLPQKAQAIADYVLSGMERRVRVRVSDRVLSWLLRIEQLGAPRFGRGLRVTDACTGCGWCARGCPGANIRMKDGRPEFLKQCALCTRCVYGCPTEAIRPTRMKFMVLKGGFDIRRYEKLSAMPEEEPGVLWEGIRRYLNGDGI